MKLRDLSIKARLNVISGAAFLTLLVLLSIGGLGIRAIQEDLRLLKLLEAQGESLQVTLRGANEILLTEGSSASLKLTSDGLQALRRTADEIHARIGGGLREDFEKSLEPALADLAGEVSVFLKAGAFSAGNDEAMIRLGKISALGERCLELLDKLTAAASAQSEAYARRIFAAAAALSLLIFAGGVALARVTQRSVSRSIEGLQAVMRRARAEGNLTVRAATDTNDEIGAVARDLNALLESFEGIVREMHAHVDQLLAAAGKLAAVSRQVTGASTQQRSAAAAARIAVQDIESGLRQVTELVQSTDAASRGASELAVRGTGEAREAIGDMALIAAAVGGLSERISALAQRSEKISGIVGVIKDIAEQTNLLALNAAIEAARAGDRGRGFAVVADEVRKLAERTSQATADIRKLIGAVQGEITGTVEVMTTTHGQVEQESRRFESVGESLAAIAEAATAASGRMTGISSATRAQEAVVGKIVANVEEISSMADTNAAAIQSAAQAAASLEGLAGEIRDYLGRFKA